MMGFTEAVATCFRKYVTFSGRASRSEYWWFYLFNILVLVGLGGAFLAVGMSLPGGIDGLGDPGVAGSPMGVLSIVLMILLLVAVFGQILPSLAVTARRLHDMGVSGWWLILVLILGQVGALGVIAVMVWMAWPTQSGPNRFGPDPREGGERLDEVFA